MTDNHTDDALIYMGGRAPGKSHAQEMLNAAARAATTGVSLTPSERSERAAVFSDGWIPGRAECQMCGRYHPEQENGLCPIQPQR